jgi:hypothetical protein
VVSLVHDDYKFVYRCIYVRTKFAWYILDTPSGEYRTFFARYFLLHRLVHSVASFAMREPHKSYDEFLADIESNDVAVDDLYDVKGVLLRPLCRNDYSNERNVCLEAVDCVLGLTTFSESAPDQRPG